jgi:isopentenyldiphosphate isomerase
MTGTPELFDVCDPWGHPLGLTKPRDDVHRDGDWHRSAHLWIVTSTGLLLFQRRARDKDTWPGRFDASVGGHYQAGEGREGPVREAREELGLSLDVRELIALGVRRVESRDRGIVDRELQDIFLLRRDLALTAYRPDPQEIDGLALLSVADAVLLHAGTLDRATALVLPRGAAAPERAAVTPSDLIPGRGPYLAALARAIDDAQAGRHPRDLDLWDLTDGG